MTSLHEMTPEEAWEALRSGNERFMQGNSDHPNQDLGRRHTLTQANDLTLRCLRAPIPVYLWKLCLTRAWVTYSLSVPLVKSPTYPS